MMKLLRPRILFALFILLLFSACATTVHISEGLSPAQLIQRAQEAVDRSRYRVAIQHFEALRDRNSDNIALVITAEYGIAFIHFRQRNFDEAREGFNALLARYEGPDAVWLPQQYMVLSRIVLERIDELEAQRRPFSRR